MKGGQNEEEREEGKEKLALELKAMMMKLALVAVRNLLSLGLMNSVDAPAVEAVIAQWTLMLGEIVIMVGEI